MSEDLAAGELLAHRLDGEGETVLLLNGGMMTIAGWGGSAERLAEHYSVLRCDFRGQMLSPGDGYLELSEHVEDLVRLLDHLEIARVHVVGVSFGGEVAILLAATQPSRVSSLCVVTATDVITESFRVGSRRMRGIIADVLAGGDRGPFHDAMVEDIYSEAYVAAHRQELTARRRMLDAIPEGWFRSLDRLLLCTEQVDLRPHLAAIIAPAMVVIAGDDQVMPPERSRALAEALSAEVRELPDSGHALITEYPEWLTEQCLGFLRRHAGAGQPQPGP